MELRIEYILKKQLKDKLKGTNIKETVNNCNIMLKNYTSFNFEQINKPFIICDNLIYTNTNDLSKKYNHINSKQFKEIINSFIQTRDLEDIAFIIEYCI